MKKKVKMITAVPALAIISLLIILVHSQPPQVPPSPDICPVLALTESSRDNTPSPQDKAVVADESREISTQNSPHDSTTIEADFEAPNTADSKEILTERSTPRDNPTPTLSQTSVSMWRICTKTEIKSAAWAAAHL